MLLAGAPEARADWVVSPFLGISFDGTTNFLDLENGVGEVKITFGGSGGWLSDGLIGLEANIGHTYGFFQSGDESGEGGLVLSSSVTAITGDALVLVPRAILRDSLRPYVLGGLGLLRVRSEYVADTFRIDGSYLGLALGGGAIGRLTERSSLRFELRRLSNLTRTKGHDLLLPGDPPALSFWRVTVGVQISY